MGSSSSWRGWHHLAPGIHHLVATTRKDKEGEKGEQSNREYSSKVLASIRSILSMHWYQMEGLYLWTELQNARIEGEGLAYRRLASSSSSKHLATCRRVKNRSLIFNKHIVTPTPRDPSPTPCRKAISEPHIHHISNIHF